MIITTDPIADMLTRIRNAALIGSRTVVLPYSKAKRAVAEVLVQSGWVRELRVSEDNPRQLSLTLKYDERGRSVIHMLRSVSKPGRRVYVSRRDLPVVANNLGMAIVSTPQGMMTNREARRRGLGGEVICEVY